MKIECMRTRELLTPPSQYDKVPVVSQYGPTDASLIVIAITKGFEFAPAINI